MANELIQIGLSAETAAQLREAAQAVGIADIRDAVAAAIAEWVARYGNAAASDAADEKYFVNQALDDLAAKRRGDD